MQVLVIFIGILFKKKNDTFYERMINYAKR